MRLTERRKELILQIHTDTYLEEQVVICNDEDTDGRARVTMDEERVLHVD